MKTRPDRQLCAKCAAAVRAGDPVAGVAARDVAPRVADTVEDGPLQLGQGVRQVDLQPAFALVQTQGHAVVLTIGPRRRGQIQRLGQRDKAHAEMLQFLKGG